MTDLTQAVADLEAQVAENAADASTSNFHLLRLNNRVTALEDSLEPAPDPAPEPEPEPPSPEPPGPTLFIPGHDGNPNVGTHGDLEVYNGSLRADGTELMLEGYDVTGLPQAMNGGVLRLVNCRVRPTSQWWAVKNDPRNGGSRVFIEDCEIGDKNGSFPAFAGVAIAEVKRTLVHHCSDGFDPWGGPMLMEQVHIRDHASTAADPHADAVQVTGGGAGMIVRYCNLTGLWADGSPANAAIILNTDFSPISDIDIHNNYLGGGNYTLYHRTKHGYGITGVRVWDNLFGRDYRYGSVSSDTPFGRWENNQYEDGELL